MRTPKLAALELKKFGRGRLPRAAMAALLLLPLLYGALYLWSFWDPYGRLDKIPVALVNADRGATAGGTKIAAGDALAAKLHDTATFDWQETDSAGASEGLENGSYYLTLTIPADFSERIASSSGGHPETGALQVRTNDSNNYIVGQLSRSVFSQVRAATSAGASRGFYDRIFVSFSDLHDQTQKAAKGADDVAGGAGSAEQGSKDLGDGIRKAEQGAGQLAARLKDAKKGSGDLATGLDTLDSGAGQVASGTQRLVDAVNGASDKIAFVKSHTREIGEASRLVADGSQAVKDHLNEIAVLAPDAAKASRSAADFLRQQYTKQCAAAPGTSACQTLKQGVDKTAEAAALAERLNAKVGGPSSFDQLATDLGTLQGYARELADTAPHLSTDIDSAVKNINRLNTGAHQVASGAHSAAGGAHSLDKGVGALSNGADTLSGGMYRLATGSNQLTTGLTTLSTGSGQLATGLHDGVDKIPDYDTKERDARTSVMADPVQLASQALHQADTYGEGLAPYFIPLSLWVGAMVGYMLFQPLNRRALAAGAASWRIALAGWLPVAAVGVLQVLALMSVLHWALGLQMARAAGTIGFLLLAAGCFAAIIQFLGARFGPAGRVLTLAMLMLQLTSAGGTYPVQTSPGFFGAIHPFLPMSYVVEGLRHLITGGGLRPVWLACLVLLAFTAGALALTTVTARRKQVWTVDRLHPELTL
ncbi:YhgE/Pip domain-containing protein [Streptomyces sp. H10-C2]|uniref:YhgE/Pip domain-containing protein n=1 Tax=unclassified Streptomyces TaxID=2593676 RepID=UPI0024BB86E6|nr:MULTISPECIES: YhgE/Pip domain-containing protein [unclassified Streptomyces]MDJ0341097.1 YhgE/Pip domain-containing protein [Streptomyces sp. PH10-H1]MDJ0369551.1 YhgE/Pip domain-containing protein [Streptomyces sp. H10-C2]